MDKQHIDSIDHIKESIEARKKKMRRIKRRKFLRKLVKVICVVAIVTLIVMFDRSEYSRFRDIRVVGNELISTQEIMEKLDLNVGDRMVFNGEKRIEKRLHDIEGLDTIDATIYYKQGILNVKVKEHAKIGYVRNETLEVLYADGSRRSVSKETLRSINGLPLFVGFEDDKITPDLLKGFSELNSEILLTISEVHRSPESYDEFNMKLVMNNNYFVYTGISALPLLRSYASIIDRADPENRCIYLLEYGPTSESQIATAKRCDE